MRGDVAAVSEILDWAACLAWQVTPEHGDRFLAEAQRGRSVKTRPVKAGRIASFYEFLEARYRGESRKLTGRFAAALPGKAVRPTEDNT